MFDVASSCKAMCNVELLPSCVCGLTKFAKLQGRVGCSEGWLSVLQSWLQILLLRAVTMVRISKLASLDFRYI
jgi:hypothetical protein